MRRFLTAFTISVALTANVHPQVLAGQENDSYNEKLKWMLACREIMSYDTLGKIRRRVLAVEGSFLMDQRISNQLGLGRYDHEGYSVNQPWRVKQLRLCRPVDNRWYYVTVFTEPRYSGGGKLEDGAMILAVKTARVDEDSFVTTFYHFDPGNRNLLLVVRYDSGTDAVISSGSPSDSEEYREGFFRALKVWSDIVTRIDTQAIASGREDLSFSKQKTVDKCPED